MFSSVTLPGTGNNVLEQGRSGADTREKDFLILTVVKQDHIFTGKSSHPQGGLTRVPAKH